MHVADDVAQALVADATYDTPQRQNGTLTAPLVALKFEIRIHQVLDGPETFDCLKRLHLVLVKAQQVFENGGIQSRYSTSPGNGEGR